jgi:hypothetical protein
MKNQEPLEKGVLYYAQGKKYLREAINSAKSFRRHHRNIPICLKTPERNFSSPAFDIIEYVEPLDHHFKTKVLAIKQTPFINTLFVDTDTKFLKPVPELFDFLLTYDLGLSFLPLCIWHENAAPTFIDYVDTKKYNTGVIIFKINDRVSKFLDLWLEKVKSHKMGLVDGQSLDDQVDFNELVIGREIHIALGISIVNLPGTKYNARPWYWKKLKEMNQLKDVKILHAHGLEKPYFIRKFINIRHHLIKKYFKR